MTRSVPRARQSGLRALLAGPVGICLANYEFGVYGTMAALVINKLFFPTLSPVAGTLAAFSTFAAGFLAKPLGGLVFGLVGDRYGRRVVVVSALVLMGIATIGIGLLPPYATIGVAAPVLLTVLRLVQGFAVGGEWGGAATLAVEHAPGSRRGRWGGAVGIGGPVGTILGSLTVLPLTALLTPQQFLDWGWRLPFLLSAVLVGFGLWMRLGVAESPVFRNEVEGAPRPRLGDVVTRNFPAMALVFFLAGVVVTGVYLLNTYLVSYAVGRGFERTAVLGVVTTAQIVAVAVTVVLLLRVDRIGLVLVYRIGAVALAVLVWALLAALDAGSLPTVLVVLAMAQIAVNAMAVASVPIYVLLFRPADRVTGAGFGFKTSDAILGGTTPLVAGLLVQASGGATWAVATYLTFVAAVGIAASVLGRHLLAAATPGPVAGRDDTSAMSA